MHDVALARAQVLSPFAAAVVDGLSRPRKMLSPEWLYDGLGSALFEAICHLPWYRITAAETRLLEQHAAAIARRVSDPAFVCELGPGSGDKLARLVGALAPRFARPRVHLVDVSPEALAVAARAVSRAAAVDVSVECATWDAALRRLPLGATPAGGALVAFLGSNIGNLDPADAAVFLGTIRRALRQGDHLLLGVDLVKPAEALRVAYDDPLGVTAAFDRNLLVRMNEELGADVDLATFDHEARWNALASRVEMHLVSRVRQQVRIPEADLVVSFEPGESIWTESSYKYEPEAIASLAEAGGFDVDAQWIDPDARFSLTLLEAGPLTAPA